MLTGCNLLLSFHNLSCKTAYCPYKNNYTASLQQDYFHKELLTYLCIFQAEVFVQRGDILTES